MNKQEIVNAKPLEAKKLKELAVGRLLRMMSRKRKPSDDKDYYNCRFIILYAGINRDDVFIN